MSIYSSSTISDEEILEELRKLGYEEISSDIFAMIKDDLEKMIRKELLSSSFCNHNNVKDLSMSDVNSAFEHHKSDKTTKVFSAVDARCRKLSSPEQPSFRKTKSLNPIHSDNDNVSISSNQKSKLADSPLSTDSLTAPFKNLDINSCYSIPLRNSKNISYNSELDSKGDNLNYKNKTKSAKCNIADELKRIFFNNSLEVQDSTINKACEHSASSLSSTSSNEKMIKRKVFRRKNGKPFITEELISIPLILDTSYPESSSLNNSNSFSSCDLSPKSNSSSGSISVLSPKPLRSLSSTLSLSSHPSTAMRILNSRKKKHDPVTRYGYYKKFWDNFKPPGEKNHDKLRWAVRDKMLDYHL